MQSDNGGEFKGVLEELLIEQGIKIIHGRARHLQLQGLVEQGNYVTKRKLESWQTRTRISSWVAALPFIALAMNKNSHPALPNKMLPYELFFGRESHWEERVPQKQQAWTAVRGVYLPLAADAKGTSA